MASGTLPREEAVVTDRDLELKRAWSRLVTGLIAVSPHLAHPYPDDSRWTPWSRFVEKEIDDMDAAVGAYTDREP